MEEREGQHKIIVSLPSPLAVHGCCRIYALRSQAQSFLLLKDTTPSRHGAVRSDVVGHSSCIALVLLPRGESHKRTMVCRGIAPFRNSKKVQKAEKHRTKSVETNPSEKRHANLPVKTHHQKDYNLQTCRLFVCLVLLPPANDALACTLRLACSVMMLLLLFPYAVGPVPRPVCRTLP